LLGTLEASTGIRKIYFASFLSLLLLLLVFRGWGLSLLVGSIGFLYPMHRSMKTIENCGVLYDQIRREEEKAKRYLERGMTGLEGGSLGKIHTMREIQEKREEIISQLRQWLIYWVVYGLFNMLESWSDTALSWLPVYHPTKLIFLLWCFLPQYQGSQLVFDVLVRPMLQRHEQSIEQGVETAQQAGIAGVRRVSRVVRAKSIQLSQAITTSGMRFIQNQASALTPSNSFSFSSSTHAHAPDGAAPNTGAPPPVAHPVRASSMSAASESAPPTAASLLSSSSFSSGSPPASNSPVFSASNSPLRPVHPPDGPIVRSRVEAIEGPISLRSRANSAAGPNPSRLSGIYEEDEASPRSRGASLQPAASYPSSRRGSRSNADGIDSNGFRSTTRNNSTEEASMEGVANNEVEGMAEASYASSAASVASSLLDQASQYITQRRRS